jgi:Sec-independent protein translocase protein TatA
MSEQITSDNKVQLGCGTLIIIALIVIIFSGGKDTDKLRRQLEDMSKQLDRLEKKVDDLSQKVSRQASSTAPDRKFIERVP